jgi:hypothetical protein
VIRRKSFWKFSRGGMDAPFMGISPLETLEVIEARVDYLNSQE